MTIGPNESAEHHHRWATTAEEEKAAFETLVDELTNRWKNHPNLHVNHYAPYEPSALERLMGRYATRADELDAMLRAGKFIYLY